MFLAVFFANIPELQQKVLGCLVLIRLLLYFPFFYFLVVINFCCRCVFKEYKHFGYTDDILGSI